MKTNIFRYAISLAAVFAAIVSCDKKQPEEEQKGPEKVDPIFPSSVVNETVKAGQSVDLKFIKNGASDRNRTGDNHVGNVMLYQLSYTRTC